MKKFLITYAIFSVLIGVGIYFVTLTLAYNQRVYEVYYELADQAVETQDFDEFISMQSIAYKNISREETDDYIIDLYHVIGKDGDTYINQLGIFVLPTSDVDFALHVEDQDDQTGIRVIDLETSNTFYETYSDPAYQGAAVSYGLSLMSFYFYAISFEEDLNLEIELYDYHEDLFANFNTSVQTEQYPDLTTGFNDGLSPERLEELIDQDEHVYPKLIQNLTIYILVDILIGAVIYFIIKKKQI